MAEQNRPKIIVGNPQPVTADDPEMAGVVQKMQEAQGQTAEILGAIFSEMKGKLGNAPVAPHRDTVVDQSKLTTKEESVRFAKMLDQDFVQWNAKEERAVNAKHLYHVEHISPRWVSSNPDEHIAIVHVTKFERMENDANGKAQRKIIGNFQMPCREFEKQYHAAMISAAVE